MAFFATRRSWQSRSEQGRRSTPAPRDVVDAVEAPEPASDDDPDQPLDGRTRLVAVGSVLLFFVYTGIEVIAGQWAFSLFTIQRGVPVRQAGAWIGVYWVAMTTGRIVFGWVSERVAVLHILRGALMGAAVGIGLLLPRSLPVLAPIGLAVLGFSLAPMFPLLIGETPRRVGTRLANHLIGFQIAAANLGAVSLVAAVGLGVELVNLEVVPWALGALFLTFAGLHETVAHVSRVSHKE
jgi:fucose permease